MFVRSRSRVPPGVQFVQRSLRAVLGPILGFWLFSFVIKAYAGVQLPAIIVAIGTVLTVPSVYALRIVFHRLRTRQKARRLGAVLPPRWDGNALGNWDLLQHALQGFANGYLGEGIWDRIQELGHLHTVDVLWDTLYLTDDAAVIKTILATDFAHFEKGELFRDIAHSVLGTGVFNADGELWKFHRMMTRPYFSRDRISHFELFDVHAETAINRMKERFRGGHAVDFQDLVLRFTLDSATEFLFGTCVRTLQSDLPYAHNDPAPSKSPAEVNAAEKFSRALLGAQSILALRLRYGWSWVLPEFFKDQCEDHMRVIDAFLQPILDEAIAKNRGKVGDVQGDKEDIGDEDETLLDHLVKITDDPVVLHDETLNILFAGRDTTAATLTLVVYLLCLYPDVFKRLRAEVLEALGQTRTPDFDDVRQLKYLRAVINETLRLYPIVPFNMRVSTVDTTLPNPSDPDGPRVFIPANTAVSYSVLMLQRRKDYWGPDALYFDPDRWLDERLNTYFTVNPFIFLPFNAGPRICLGQQFAYNEISFFLIRLIQQFSHMELDLSAQPPDSLAPRAWAGAEGQKGKEKLIPRCHLTLSLQGGLWVRMTEAGQEHA
ncbi:cytochrome P450 monooxygenase pc-3 [Trametes cingulata]|nr:cytochrome P450 monooxygenase pc-3 [Trametes cingulata]